MARNHARLLTRIWNDDDFLDLSAGGQRLYMLLLSQQNLSHAGLLPMTVKRWANKAKNTTVEQVEAWLSELERAAYVFTDERTEELLIRTLMRGDEVWKQINVTKAACKDALSIASDKLQRVMACEVEKMLALAGLAGDVERELTRLADALPNPSPTPPEPLAMSTPDPGGRGSVTNVTTASPSPAPSPTPTPATSAKPPSAELVHIRRDVEQVCERLVLRMVDNGCKRPTITEKWRTDARLLIDRDQRPLAEILALIDWCQTDDFWRANVESVPTFRKQYDRLRLQAQRSAASADDKTRGHLELIERLAQENR